MAFTIMKNGDNTQSTIVELLVDTRAEINDLPTNYGIGSDAIVLDDSSVWMLGSDFEWHEL